jgi:hypothetical protein
MTAEAPKSRRCPYCGCGFEPQTPDQRYCSPFCEQEDLARKERADAAPPPGYTEPAGD